MRIKKVINGRNYGSIPHLIGSKLGEHDKYLHEGQDAIIRKGGRDKHDRLFVSVKLDGTNVGVVKLGGKLISLQRKGYGCADSPYRQHHEFDKWVRNNHSRLDHLLREGERVAGEWLWQASGIKYEISGDPFFAFDIFDPEKVRIPWDESVGRICDAGIRYPMFCEAEKLEDHMIELMMSRFGSAAYPVQPVGETHEGLVARIERRGAFDFMAKWVRPDFVAGKYLPGLTDNSPTEITINTFI